MRINLVSFLNPNIYSGGGEMISRSLLEAGLKRGHEIRISSVRPAETSLHDAPDLSLLIDIFNFGHSWRSLGAWRAFGENFLSAVIARAPFVHLTNAYVDICNLPYLPCSGSRAGRCPAKTTLTALERLTIRDWDNRCFAHRAEVRRLYEQAALNVYLSPLHRRVTETLLESEQLPPSYVLKPLIDTNRFTNHGLERDIEYLFVGVIGEAKGLATMRERFRDADIHFIGKIAPGESLDFGTYHGSVPYRVIPDFMNRAKYFVFLPRWPEPQGRVVIEAALCGCELVTNQNVGATSFPFDISDPTNFAEANAEFWTTIEQLPS